MRPVILASRHLDADRAFSASASATPPSLYDPLDREEMDETEGKNIAKDDKTIKAKPATTQRRKAGPGTKKLDTGDSYIAGSACSIDPSVRFTQEPRGGKRKKLWDRVRKRTASHDSTGHGDPEAVW